MVVERGLCVQKVTSSEDAKSIQLMKRNDMSKLKSPICKTRNVVLGSLIASISLLLPFPLAAEVGRPEVQYKSCAQLQKHLNDNNNDEFKGFERAKLMMRTYVEHRYMLYCNGGVIIDRDEKTICRGYIGYSYAPKSGVTVYYGSWGWTDGSPNNADSGKERYCRRLK
jgi:hypothetical protein